jgi:hypothetical protein
MYAIMYQSKEKKNVIPIFHFQSEYKPAIRSPTPAQSTSFEHYHIFLILDDL